MKILDLASSFFLLAFSTVAFVGSLRIGVGHLNNPGMGFMPLGASLALGALSLVLFIRALLSKEQRRPESLFAGKAWKRSVFVVLVLFLYAGMMPTAGYLIGTFIAMALIFWVLDKQRPGVVLMCALLSTFLTHLVFSKWLNCQFPVGFFGY